MDDAPPLGEAALALPPDLAARYRQPRLLGAGGLGRVFRCVDARLGRPVALKLLVLDKASGPRFVRRFQREARLLAALAHPNVVRLYDVHLDRPPPFFTMELIDGPTFEAVLRGPRRPVRWVVETVARMADGLAAAHGARVLHRDLKPANVMLASDERPVLTDFGCGAYADGAGQTALTRTDEMVGTPRYAAPEYLLEGRHDERSDLYQLGLLLFALLTGRPPLAAKSLGEIVAFHRSWTEASHDPPSLANPDVDPGLDALALEVLHREPSRRPASADDLARRCRAWLAEGGGGPSARRTRPDRPSVARESTARLNAASTASTIRPGRTRSLLPALAAAALLGLAAGGVLRGPLPWAGGRAPLAALDLAVEAGGSRARVSFRTAEPRRLDWRLLSASGSRVVTRGAEVVADARHRVELAGLGPLQRYRLLLSDAAEETSVEVATRAGSLLREVLAFASPSALWADFETDLPRATLVVAAPGQAPVAVSCPGGKGPLLVPGLHAGPESSVQWTLRSGETVLATGRARCKPRFLRGTRPPWFQADGTVAQPTPLAMPLWMGDLVAFPDWAGDLRAYRLQRNSAEPLGLAFALAPACAVFRGGPLGRTCAGIVAVPGGLALLAVAPGGRRAAWRVDPVARAERWAALDGPTASTEGPTGAPAEPPWLDAPDAPWNASLSPTEWRTTVSLDGIPFARGVLEGDGWLTFLATDRRCGFARLSLATRSLQWTNLSPDAGVQLIPEVLGPVLAGGRVAATLDTYTAPKAATPEAPGTAFLAFSPAGPRAPQAPASLFAFRRATRSGCGVVADPERGDVLFSGFRSVFRLAAGAALPETSCTLPPPPPGSIEYFSGPPARLGTSWAVTCIRQQPLPGLGGLGISFTARLASWRPGGRVTLHEPPVLEGMAVANQPCSARELLVTERYLAGCTNLGLFVVDRATGQLGTWRPTDFSFEGGRAEGASLDGLAVNPDDLAAVTDRFGRVFVQPLALIAAGGSGRLAGLP